MKIILKQDYDFLGAAGDLKEVKNGYARNYLIPRGIASIATKSNLKIFEEIKKQKSRKVEKEITEAKKLSLGLENTTITFVVKTAEEDKIYGSVTSQMIHDYLVGKGFEKVEKKKIMLHEPIKSLGEHFVDVKLHSNVFAKIKVIVEKEKPVEVDETPVEAPTTE